MWVKREVILESHPEIHGLSLRIRMRETMGHFPSNPSPPSTGRTLKGLTSSKIDPIVFPPCPATFPRPLMVYLFDSGGVLLRHIHSPRNEW